jgi:hypothetical protein
VRAAGHGQPEVVRVLIGRPKRSLQPGYVALPRREYIRIVEFDLFGALKSNRTAFGDTGRQLEVVRVLVGWPKRSPQPGYVALPTIEYIRNIGLDLLGGLESMQNTRNALGITGHPLEVVRILIGRPKRGV